MRVSPLLLAGLAALALGCGGTGYQRVQVARQQAHAKPSYASAIQFATAIHTAVTESNYADRNVLVRDVLDALRAIDRVSTEVAAERATLVYWRGVLLTHTGDFQAALSEYQRSFAIAPTYTNSKLLVQLYGAGAKPDEVVTTCQRAMTTLANRNEKLAIADRCEDNLATAPTTMQTAWLSPELQTWLTQARATRQADGAKIEPASARHQQMQRLCHTHCTDDKAQCLTLCSGEGSCEARCQAVSNTCFARCQQFAYEPVISE